ncbi:MAG TPA: protein kinase [Candidatus Limnocylindria bacterium]
MSLAGRDPDALLGRTLGNRYRIEEALARGGMARVYRATDLRLERPVAVKVLAPPYADDPEFADRFLSEARVAASFSHPNLAHVYDSGSDGGLGFMVMELLERHRSVRSLLRERGRLEPLEAIATARDVLAGLEPLHAHGLVHCDVKPGNVMVGPDGTKLIDFGIARPLNRPPDGGTSIGSLHAMSPEQLRGDQLTPASDLFAVGVLLYECLTGRVPFPGGSPDEVAAAHRRGPVAPPSELAAGVVPLLDDAVLQALRTEPPRRFESAAAMARALESAAAAQREPRDARPGADDTTAVHAVVPPGPATATSRPARVAPRRSRVGPTVALLAAVALPLVIAGALLLGPGSDGGGAPGASSSTTGTPAEETLAPGTVRVPNTIGMSEAEAEAAARAAGLAWRIEWRVVPGQTPGIYAQDPAAGTVVAEGSRFVMQAYRSR